MPELQKCAVCSALLADGKSSEGVMPPRARDRTLGQRIRQRVDLGEYVLFVRNRLSGAGRGFAVGTPVAQPQWWHVLLCVVPGMGHCLALGNLGAGFAQFLVALCALFVCVSFPGTKEGAIAASVVLSLSVFSVFVFVEKHWGSKENGRRAWVHRILLLLGILICFSIVNYYLGYVVGIVRFLSSLLN